MRKATMLTTILIDILGRSGGRLGMTRDGAPVMSGITEPLASEVRRHFADLTLPLALSSTTAGSRFRLCPVCWREAMTTSSRKCFLTPGCKGKLTDVVKVGSPPEHEGTTCARPGCERAGWRSTHWGAVYCLADWHSLVLLDLVEDGRLIGGRDLDEGDADRRPMA